MLTTTTLVKSHLGIAGATYDTLLASLVSMVDNYIEHRTGVKVAQTTAVTVTEEIADARDENRIRVKFKPLLSLTKVEYKQSDNTWAEYTDEAVGDIDFDTEGNQIYPLYRVVAEGKRNLRISYTCGYLVDSATVPADLQLCATLLVASAFNRRGNEGVSSSSMEGLSQTFEDITVKDSLVRDTLTKYSDVYAF